MNIVKNIVRRVGLLLVLCGGAADAVFAAADATQGIAWYQGTVESAFASAKSEGKPLFLYWGATWCPPCNQLKATVFKRADFIAKTRFFVPVYIDGDGEGAQAYQDQFGAYGYPTLIVFDPAGREITRIPGGIDLARYLDVLDLALERVAPASEIIARVIDRNEKASAKELRLLAYYSWSQDLGRVMGKRDPIAVFLQLSQMTPNELADVRSRFDAQFLHAVSVAEKPTPQQLAQARARLEVLLTDPRGTDAITGFLAYDLVNVLTVITTPGSAERKHFLELWQTQLASLRTQHPDSGEERMRVLFGDVGVEKVRDDKVSDATKKLVRERIDQELAVATDVHDRSAVLNAALNLLDASGQIDYSMKILQAQLGDDDFGYYWMLDLADLAEESKNVDAAIGWLESAYKQSKGPATRVQWCSNYVQGLMRLRPDDVKQVGTGVKQCFAELESQKAAAHGRNRAAMTHLGTALAKWADKPDRMAVRKDAIAHLNTWCASDTSQDEKARGECVHLLDVAGA